MSLLFRQAQLLKHSNVEPLSARSIIDGVSRGGSKRKQERRQRLSSAALAVADRKVRSAYSPIVIAGVVRLIDFALISLSGMAVYFGYGTPAGIRGTTPF